MISLHEAVEKGRHEKGLDLDGAASAAEGYMGNPMTFSEYKIGLSPVSYTHLDVYKRQVWQLKK